MTGETKEHPFQRWEVSIIKLENEETSLYKVTRRMPEMAVAETKVFLLKEDAKAQFERWLE